MGWIDEVANIRERGNGVEPVVDGALGPARRMARVHVHVLATGKVRIEASAEFEEGRRPLPLTSTVPDVGVSVPQISCSRVDLP